VASRHVLGRARALVARLLRSYRSDAYAREVAAELDAHIALHTADNIRRGLNPTLARRDALIQLGGVQQTRECCLDAMTFRWIARWGRRARILRPLSR
jgi:hypothetical protein